MKTPRICAKTRRREQLVPAFSSNGDGSVLWCHWNVLVRCHSGNFHLQIVKLVTELVVGDEGPTSSMVIHIQKQRSRRTLESSSSNWSWQKLQMYHRYHHLTLVGARRSCASSSIVARKGRYLRTDEAIACAELTRLSSYQFNPVWLFTLVGNNTWAGRRKYNDQLVA
jgi:hypothetical protein